MGAKKLTKADMESWLVDDGRGIKIIGDYIDTKTKTKFECTHGHQWDTVPNNIKGGTGCPDCAGNIKRTYLPSKRNLAKSDMESWLITDGRGIKMIGDYVNARTKMAFECVHGHRWYPTPNRIKSGHGCPECADTKLLKSDIESWLIEDDRGIKLVGDYVNVDTETTFECEYGHLWSAPAHRIRQDHGCPNCSSGGFKPNLPAWEYIFTRGTYLKYGISNKLNRRLADHKKHGEIEIVHLKQHDIGQHALDWENQIKQKFGGKYVTDALCPDGWTETLPISHLQLLLEEKFIDKIHST